MEICFNNPETPHISYSRAKYILRHHLDSPLLLREGEVIFPSLKYKMIKINDYPKLESPFVREVNKNGDYVVTFKIAEGMEWVFEGDETIVAASEKVNGSNSSILFENGEIKRIFNRTEHIPFFNKGKSHFIEGVLEAYKRGMLDDYINAGFTGQVFGEMCGEKINQNELQITGHLFIPFDWLIEHCSYKSFHKYPKSFEGLQEWFTKPISEGGIFSLFMKRKGIDMQPEGIVFHNLKTKQKAKIRRDMFQDYRGERHNNGIKNKKEEDNE